MKKLSIFCLVSFLIFSFCGCAIVGSALSESRKATKTVPVAYKDAIEMVKKVIEAENIQFVSAVIKTDIAQIKGFYNGEKKMFIKIVKLGDQECQIEVRVGTSESGRADAQKILQEIIGQSLGDYGS